MKARVTLKDIARHLDLSVSAISKALHHDPSISGPQRERIQQVAELLGYRPDPGLSALSAYRLKSGVRPAFAPLAFLGFAPYGHDWTDPFFDGAREQAERLGYRLNAYHLSPEFSLRRHGQILHAQGVRGLVLAPLPSGMTTMDFDWSGFSVVAIGRSLLHPALHRASPDAFEGLLLAVEKARELGHRRIGIAITREQNLRAGWSWTAAAAVARQQVCALEDRVILYEDTTNRPDDFFAWLRKEKPSIVLSLKHPIPGWLREAGEDVALVSLHHDPAANLPGIDQNFGLVGAAAVNVLHSSLIHGETGVPASRQTLLVQPHWVPALAKC